MQALSIIEVVYELSITHLKIMSSTQSSLLVPYTNQGSISWNVNLNLDVAVATSSWTSTISLSGQNPCQFLISWPPVLLFFFDHVITHFGIPKTFVSKNGTHFQNEILYDLSCLLGFFHALSMPYYPQDNIQVEDNEWFYNEWWRNIKLIGIIFFSQLCSPIGYWLILRLLSPPFTSSMVQSQSYPSSVRFPLSKQPSNFFLILLHQRNIFSPSRKLYDDPMIINPLSKIMKNSINSSSIRTINPSFTSFIRAIVSLLMTQPKTKPLISFPFGEAPTSLNDAQTWAHMCFPSQKVVFSTPPNMVYT